MKITTAYLKQLRACKSGIDEFNDLFPDGEAELNSENLSKARCGGLDIIWLIERIADQATLAKLSNDESVWVREAVARHPNTPPIALVTLSNDKSESVRRRVARHPSTPPIALAKLSSDEDYSVRCRVADNPNTPQGTTNEAETR